MRTGGSKRVANSLVAMGSAAVLTVYATGFLRTRAAAQKLAGADQRRVAPAPAEAGGTASPPFIEPPAVVARTESPQPANPVTRDTRDTSRAATPPAPKREEKATKAPDATPTPAPAAVPAVEPVTPPVPATVTSAPPVEPVPPPAPKPNLYKDGTYYGWGTSRHGDIQASVVIEDGRIAAASITQCLTRYSCSWIAHLQGQIVSRQSPECDYVSGATQSTNAFYYAIVEALSKAK